MVLRPLRKLPTAPDSALTQGETPTGALGGAYDVVVCPVVGLNSRVLRRRMRKKAACPSQTGAIAVSASRSQGANFAACLPAEPGKREPRGAENPEGERGEALRRRPAAGAITQIARLVAGGSKRDRDWLQCSRRGRLQRGGHWGDSTNAWAAESRFRVRLARDGAETDGASR